MERGASDGRMSSALRQVVLRALKECGPTSLECSDDASNVQYLQGFGPEVYCCYIGFDSDSLTGGLSFVADLEFLRQTHSGLAFGSSPSGVFQEWLRDLGKQVVENTADWFLELGAAVECSEPQVYDIKVESLAGSPARAFSTTQWFSANGQNCRVQLSFDAAPEVADLLTGGHMTEQTDMVPAEKDANADGSQDVVLAINDSGDIHISEMGSDAAGDQGAGGGTVPNLSIVHKVPDVEEELESVPSEGQAEPTSEPEYPEAGQRGPVFREVEEHDPKGHHGLLLAAAGSEQGRIGSSLMGSVAKIDQLDSDKLILYFDSGIEFVFKPSSLVHQGSVVLGNTIITILRDDSGFHLSLGSMTLFLPYQHAG